MSGKKMKLLRSIARAEMTSNSQEIERNLVITRITGKNGSGTGVRLINEPLSVRAMERAMKKHWKAGKRQGLS